MSFFHSLELHVLSVIRAGEVAMGDYHGEIESPWFLLSSDELFTSNSPTVVEKFAYKEVDFPSFLFRASLVVLRNKK